MHRLWRVPDEGLKIPAIGCGVSQVTVSQVTAAKILTPLIIFLEG